MCPQVLRESVGRRGVRCQERLRSKERIARRPVKHWYDDEAEGYALKTTGEKEVPIPLYRGVGTESLTDDES